MTILEKIKFEEDWLSEVNLTKENIKIAFAGIRATALESQRWIPVSERLPEESGDYLVAIKWKGKYSGNIYTETDVIEYEKNKKKWICGDGDVIAWMSLPELYKAESEGEK